MHSADRDIFLEGTSITFTCPPGLVLTGPNSSTCMGNGEWEPNPNEVKCKGEHESRNHDHQWLYYTVVRCNATVDSYQALAIFFNIACLKNIEGLHGYETIIILVMLQAKPDHVNMAISLWSPFMQLIVVYPWRRVMLPWYSTPLWKDLGWYSGVMNLLTIQW